MDIYDPPFDLWNEAADVPRGPGIVFYSVAVTGTTAEFFGGVTVSPWGGLSGETNIAKLEVSPFNWVLQYSGSEYGSYGDIFEVKIPIELFDDIQVNFMLAWYQSGISNVFVDEGFTWFDNPMPAPVPEPTTMPLFGTGLLGLVGIRCKKLEKA